LRPNTWNILELKVIIYLLEKGKVDFTFRKLSKNANYVNNGRFRFDVGLENFLHDEEPSSSGQNFTKELTKGSNELVWYYVINTGFENYNDLFAEITKIEISPVQYAPTQCTPCKGMHSGPGSSSCAGCPANYFVPPYMQNCHPCPESQFAYPGENRCLMRPTCSIDYDAIKFYKGECINSEQTVSFEWRSPPVCIKVNSELPPNRTEPCGSCPKGSFVESGKCKPCPENTYSEFENSKQCTTCPKGKLAFYSKKYTQITNMPQPFSTKCEDNVSDSKDPCYFFHGWIVAKGGFTVHPAFPNGAKLILRLLSNVTQNGGKLKFEFEQKSNSPTSAGAERLKLKVDGISTDIPLLQFNGKFEMDLSKGDHVIEWIYEKAGELNGQDPLIIKSIIVEGEIGTAESCIDCANGFYMGETSKNCEQCPAGYQSNTQRTKCESCEEGYYKTKDQFTCHKCPLHTHSTDYRSHCALYSAYNINNEYILNLDKFDSAKNVTILDLKETSQDGSFFGPFNIKNNTAMIFMSLARPMEYDVEKYEYEDLANSIEEGHIFELLSGERIDANPVNNKEGMKKTHYRLKKNLGSRLESVDFKNYTEGRITLKFVEGDKCGKQHYETNVILVCDKTVQSLNKLEHLEDQSSGIFY